MGRVKKLKRRCAIRCRGSTPGVSDQVDERPLSRRGVSRVCVIPAALIPQGSVRITKRDVCQRACSHSVLWRLHILNHMDQRALDLASGAGTFGAGPVGVHQTSGNHGRLSRGRASARWHCCALDCAQRGTDGRTTQPRQGCTVRCNRGSKAQKPLDRPDPPRLAAASGMEDPSGATTQGGPSGVVHAVLRHCLRVLACEPVRHAP